MAADMTMGRGDPGRHRTGAPARPTRRPGGWRGACAALAAALLAAACGGGTGDAPAPAAASAGARSATAGPGGKQAQAWSSATTFTQNGWYWNPAESGTGMMVEAQGDRGFVAFFMYEPATGKPVWYAAYGTFLSGDDGRHAFYGDLRRYAGGQPVSSPVYRAGGSSQSMGGVVVEFNGLSAAALLPGGRTMQATRFDFNGLGTPPRAHQPETGWYWNPAEGGRGWAIEVQNDQAFVAMFHYNEDGSPTWNVVQGDISTGVLKAPFELYEGGQSLASPWRPGTRRELGSYTLSFRNPCAGQVQRAGVPPVAIRRFVIEGSPLPRGAECRYLATMPDALHHDPAIPLDVALERYFVPRLAPGDAIFGRIGDAPADRATDVDMHVIRLQAGVTYRFDARGSSSGAGTLPDPTLTLLDRNGVQLAFNDDAVGRDSQIVFTPGGTDDYLLLVGQATPATGTFLLSASGSAPGLEPSPAPPLDAYAGSVEGELRGTTPGRFAWTIGADGAISGSITLDGAPDAPLPAQGQVAPGGVLHVQAGDLTVDGFMGPRGELSGTWKRGDPAGHGGILAGERAGAGIVTNQIPVAHIDAPEAATFGTTVALSGARSSDGNGDPLTHHWVLVSQPPGGTAALSSQDGQDVSLPLQVAGDYVVALRVNDGKIDSPRAVVTIRATGVDVPPRADAGPHQTAAIGATVELDGGRSSDPDSTLHYRWEFIQRPPDSGAALVGADAVRASFVADRAGTYVLRLRVADEQSASFAQTRVVVTGAGQPPVVQIPSTAVAGIDVPITLTALGTPTQAGEALSYRWAIIDGPLGGIATVTGGAGDQANFVARVPGRYTVQVVAEGAGGRTSAPVNMVVDVVPLSGFWVGGLGADAPALPAGLLFTTDGNGAVSRLTANITIRRCGHTVQLVRTFLPALNLMQAKGQVVWPNDPGVTISGGFESPTVMAGLLTAEFPASALPEGCGAQVLSLPWRVLRQE